MAWRKRKAPAPQQSCGLSDTECRDRQLDEAHAEADRALQKVQEQQREQKSLREVLAEIRERNHLAEIFDDGMRA